MDEVCDEKGIEMNDADSDDHVIKADRHNRVIKIGLEWHTIYCSIKDTKDYDPSLGNELEAKFEFHPCQIRSVISLYPTHDSVREELGLLKTFMG